MTDKSIEDLAHIFNPVIRGWTNYYGQYCKSALYPVFKHINFALHRWAIRKYKKLSGRKPKALQLLQRIAKQVPDLFVHWRFVGQLAG
jgi:RNA-directed DNA polymerase